MLNKKKALALVAGLSCLSGIAISAAWSDSTVIYYETAAKTNEIGELYR